MLLLASPIVAVIVRCC